MKRLVGISLALVLALPAAGKVVEEIVIKVNDAIVTKSDFDKRLQSTIEGMRREYKGPDLEQQIKDVPQKLLDQMEDELLLIEKAKQMYQVDMIVDNQVENFMKENNLKTKDELAKALQAEGMTMEQFRNQVLFIYVPEFMKSREIRSRISISTDEINQFYKDHKAEMGGKPQVQLQEIFVSNRDHNADQAKAVAATVQQELAKGKAFGDLAAQYSQSYSRSAKGEAGWFTPSDLSSDISKAVFALKAGDTTDLIPTSTGWFIFRVEAKKDAKTPTLDEVRDQIVEALKEEKFQKAYKDYIAELKSENYVRVNPKYV